MDPPVVVGERPLGRLAGRQPYDLAFPLSISRTAPAARKLRGDGHRAPPTSLDPSSSQPVTLPIIFFTGSPNYVLRFSKFALLNYSALLF
jgi:hypothetical protein